MCGVDTIHSQHSSANLNHTHNCFKRTFHHWIPKIQTDTLQSWERFKALWHKESDDTKFLKELLRTQEHDLNFEEHTDRLSTLILTSSPYKPEGHLLKAVTKRLNIDQLTLLLEDVFTKTLNKENDFNIPLKFIDHSHLEHIMKQKHGDEIVDQLVTCLPKSKFDQKSTSVQPGIRKTISVVINFFPQFMDTVLKAFNLIEVGKGPQSIWDFAAMLEIYYKIFMIPHGLVMLLGTLISAPLTLYLTATAITIAAIIGVCVYIIYRPCPNKLPLARNLTDEAAKGKLDPVVGRDDEIREISAFLGKDDIKTHLILVGDPGVGKTELVKGVAQQYKEKTIFYLNAPELATTGYTSFGDKLRSIFLDIKGHED